MAPPSGASARYNNPLARIGVYQHHDAQTHVVPLHGAEGNPWPGLGLLTAANLGVFALWQHDDSAAHQEWMGRHFTTNATNLREWRPWTLLTCAFSQQAPGHLAGNLFALWLFGFKPYRALNVSTVTGLPGFFGLYAAGGLAAALAHVGANVAAGKDQPPLSQAEVRRARREVAASQGGATQPAWLVERLRRADTPSLGASGAVMAITVASASLFPRDRIMMRFGVLVPIPLVAALYIATDTFAQLGGNNDGVDHAGHLGGTVAGAAYVTWVCQRAGTELPIRAWLGLVSSSPKAGWLSWLDLLLAACGVSFVYWAFVIADIEKKEQARPAEQERLKELKDEEAAARRARELEKRREMLAAVPARLARKREQLAYWRAVAKWSEERGGRGGDDSDVARARAARAHVAQKQHEIKELEAQARGR